MSLSLCFVVKNGVVSGFTLDHENTFVKVLKNEKRYELEYEVKKRLSAWKEPLNSSTMKEYEHFARDTLNRVALPFDRDMYIIATDTFNRKSFTSLLVNGFKLDKKLATKVIQYLDGRVVKIPFARYKIGR